MKIFHILFILSSTVLSFFLGIWCINLHFESYNLFYLLLGLLSIIFSLGLIVYGIYFLQKMKKAGIK